MDLRSLVARHCYSYRLLKLQGAYTRLLYGANTQRSVPGIQCVIYCGRHVPWGEETGVVSRYIVVLRIWKQTRPSPKEDTTTEWEVLAEKRRKGIEYNMVWCRCRCSSRGIGMQVISRHRGWYGIQVTVGRCRVPEYLYEIEECLPSGSSDY